MLNSRPSSSATTNSSPATQPSGTHTLGRSSGDRFNESGRTVVPTCLTDHHYSRDRHGASALCSSPALNPIACPTLPSPHMMASPNTAQAKAVEACSHTPAPAYWRIG